MNFQVYTSLLLSIILLSGCSGEADQEQKLSAAAPATFEMYGNLLGTDYAVICRDSIEVDLAEFNLLISQLNKALSTSDENSIVSRLNQAGSGEFQFVDSSGYFSEVWMMASEIAAYTDYQFNPANYTLKMWWSDHYENAWKDSVSVDSLHRPKSFRSGTDFTWLTSVDSLNKAQVTGSILKHRSAASVDFSTIGYGFSVDRIVAFLEKSGANNYYVEVGGQVRVRGLNESGQNWLFQIPKPNPFCESGKYETYQIISLADGSVSLSQQEYKKYHGSEIRSFYNLNEDTGYPVAANFWSVTVLSQSCAYAQGIGSALHAMGLENAISFLESHPQLKADVAILFTNDKGRLEMYTTQDFPVKS